MQLSAERTALVLIEFQNDFTTDALLSSDNSIEHIFRMILLVGNDLG